MRFLHLADLHLGKQMNDLSLLADQEAVLQQIISIAQSEQIDAVLISSRYQVCRFTDRMLGTSDFK